MKSVLIQVRNLISKKESWTQGAGARDVAGNKVPYTSGEAVSWCIYGAIWRIDKHSWLDIYQLFRENGVNDLVDFNDTHTHAQVIAKLDEVIASLPD